MMKKALLTCISVLATLSLVAQVRHIVKELPFNSSEHNEYAPVPYNGGLVFCSDRRSDALFSYSDEKNAPLTDIYYSQFANNSWSKASRFAPSITSYFHEGPATFGVNGKNVYFTRNILLDKKQRERNRLGIYSAELKDGDWVNILPFKYNSREYATGHPSLSTDGTRIFFISDMPGGSGGTDIYMCQLKNGLWEKPVNLGPGVNTAGNEMFPFIAPNGNLYFSSTSHNSIGGLDIFVTRYTNGQWENTQRLPEPVNSKKDDFAYVCDVSGKKGYFTSNRKGSDDIFEFLLPVPEFNDCDTLKKNNYCFELFQEGEIPADSLPLAYEWSLGDGTKVKASSVDHCYKRPGIYSVQLNVIDLETGEVFYNEASYDLEVKNHEQVFIASADTSAPGLPVPFDGSGTNVRDFVASAYYWDFGDGILDTGARITHVFTHPGIYHVRLGVTSAPGPDGNYKKACVQKKIVVTSQAKKAIASRKNEIQDKKTIPPPQQPLEIVYKVEIASSKDRIALDNALFDELKGEYSVQENYVQVKDLYSYTVGEEKNISSAWPIYKDLKSKGYGNAVVRSFADEIVSLDEMSLLSKSEASKKTVRINNALFEPGKHQLTDGARIEVEKLYRLMANNKDISAYISAHTDNEGSEVLNQALSEKRANAIVDHLVAKGISRDRLNAKGYGESMPIADNSTSEGRKLNRRVEVKIIWK